MTMTEDVTADNLAMLKHKHDHSFLIFYVFKLELNTK